VPRDGAYQYGPADHAARQRHRRDGEPDYGLEAVTEATNQDLLLAAVDIGTNSVHMVVARIGSDGRIEILDREKDMVRLGRSGGGM
jgi:hypothetical protein